MNCIKKEKKIDKLVNLFYRLSLWHETDQKATVKGAVIKLSISIYPFLYPIALLVGAVSSEFQDESILLANTGIMTLVTSIKLSYLIWKKEDIVELLQKIPCHLIDDYDTCNAIQRKLKNWSTIFGAFFYLQCFIAATSFIAPLIGTEKQLFLKIGFPLDYKNDETAYWIAYSFIFTEIVLCGPSVLFSIFMWYLMLNCGVKYEVLASELRNMGAIRNTDEETKKVKISLVARQEMFRRDLIAGIKSHKEINESTDVVVSFMSEIISIQLTISGICICCSIYCLTFTTSNNLLELVIFVGALFYNIFDIFTVMYFGNEIKLKRDQLSYCLLESNWIEQTLDCKKILIIFGERLKEPEEIVVLKLYPLSLETFSRILNSAYSMFNLLKELNS